jgi:ABC-type phosphate/phosphonate transport system substrate-binding protein
LKPWARARFSWPGTAASLTLKQQPVPMRSFAQTVNADGSKGYYAYLITNKNNPILENIDIEAGNGDQFVIENAADLTFAFNDPNSTSGFLVPSFYVFAKNEVNPNDAFKEWCLPVVMKPPPRR